MDFVLLTADESLSIGPLDGTELIKTSNDFFRKFVWQCSDKNSLSNVGVPTLETFIDVYQYAYSGASFEKIYNLLPGKWNQKWLSQNQVIEFCVTYKHWLGLYSESTVFVCKKDEEELVDESNPEENLSLIYVNYDGRIRSICITSILEFDICSGENLVRIVLPKIVT